jgi:hypothetical protein
MNNIPFSIFLTDIESWNEDNNFNSTIICNNCGQKFEKTIRRLQNNHITCPKCNKFLIQYVNAKTESIGPKGESPSVDIQNLHWDKWGGYGNNGSPFNPIWKIGYSNNYELEKFAQIMEIKSFSGLSICRSEGIIDSNNLNGSINYWWKVPVSYFPDMACNFQIQVVVYNKLQEALCKCIENGNWTGR